MHRFPLFLAAATAASFSLSVAGHEARADFGQPPAQQGLPPDPMAGRTPMPPGLAELLPPGAPLATSEEGSNERPGEILVDLRDSVSDQDIADVAATYGLHLTPNSPWSAEDKFQVAEVDPGAEDALLERLAHDPRVENAERMYLYRATFVPNDPLYEGRQWHLKRVGAESAWNYTCGRGVTVAVIDTGIACFDKGPFSRGTDLSGTRCEGGYNFVDKSTEAYDDHGHGTHVAGTIAQTTDNAKGVAGLAFCATLMPVKVLTKQGYGTSADVAEGIRFAADHGAQVINLSLGGPVRSRVIADSVKHAQSKGVIVVAAAGNSGRSVGYPAAYPGVIAVSATDAKDKIAWFSSRGPELAIAAPGVGVTQQTVCNNGRDKCEIFGTFSGTSMASPHVAGVAAMLVGLGVTDADAVRSELQKTAEPKDDPKLYGAGILNGGAAVSHAFWWRIGLRFAALLALGAWVRRRIRKRGGEPNRSAAVLGAALLAGIGLLPFVPLLGGLTPHNGPLALAAELAARPFGEWDLPLLGAGWHRWLPLASAAPTMALSALLFGVKRLRGLLGGFALGAAALLAQLAISADVSFVGGAFLLRVWAMVNMFVCLWLARVALDKKGEKKA
jgi:serine protease